MSATTSGASSQAIVQGFNPATDFFQIETQHATSFAALRLSAPGGTSTLIATGGGSILLSGVTPDALVPANFRFV